MGHLDVGGQNIYYWKKTIAFLCILIKRMFNVGY